MTISQKLTALFGPGWRALDWLSSFVGWHQELVAEADAVRDLELEVLVAEKRAREMRIELESRQERGAVDLQRFHLALDAAAAQALGPHVELQNRQYEFTPRKDRHVDRAN